MLAGIAGRENADPGILIRRQTTIIGTLPIAVGVHDNVTLPSPIGKCRRLASRPVCIFEIRGERCANEGFRAIGASI